MIDEHQETLATLHALDLLEPAERQAFEQALAGDPALRALVDQLRSTSAQLALTAPAATPPAALRQRVLTTIARRPTASEAPAASAPAPIIPFRPARWLPWSIAAACLLFAAFFASRAALSRHELQLLRDADAVADIERQSLRQQLEAESILAQHQTANLRQAEAAAAETRSQLAAERATHAAEIADLKARSDVAQLKITSLASLLGNSPEAMAIVVWDPHKQEGVLTAQHLPDLAEDKDYQLWVVDPQYQNPVDGGVFRVERTSGDARVIFKPHQPIAQVAAFAVSLERRGGVPKAEGPMVLLGKNN